MNTCKTVDDLCVERGITPIQLAERAGLDTHRVLAIAAGRWTPSPVERDKVAAALGLTRDEIAWGHRAAVEHLQGHGPQFGRSP